MSKEEKKKKPGFMQKLFGSKKLSLDEDPKEKSKEKEKARKLQRNQTVDSGGLSYDQDVAQKPKPKSQGEANGAAAKPKVKATGVAARPKEPKRGKLKRDGSVGKARRKKKEKKHVTVDVSQGVEWPCTPEYLLEYHKNKPFLSSSEEWLIVELNEFECVIDSMSIVKIIAKHSKFFEVEPDDLWEEFFEWVEECPAYDEIINYDIWQEFRDIKYPM